MTSLARSAGKKFSFQPHHHDDREAVIPNSWSIILLALLLFPSFFLFLHDELIDEAPSAAYLLLLQLYPHQNMMLSWQTTFFLWPLASLRERNRSRLLISFHYLASALDSPLELFFQLFGSRSPSLLSLWFNPGLLQDGLVVNSRALFSLCLIRHCW